VTLPRRLRVIITADDFGLASPVNEAVEQAHRAGVLTSASLMVAEDAATDAVERARRMPTLRVGLHLTVVDGRTVLPGEQVRAIVNSSGQLTDRLVRAGFSYFFRPRARRELRAEIRAQLEAFRATGLELDHVDTHRHLVLHPTVLGMIVGFAQEFGIRVIRLPAEPWRATQGQSIWRRVVAAARIVSLAPWLALARWRLRRAGICYNTEVRGLADTGTMDESTVLRLIRTLNCDITEIFFHPATATPSAVPLPQLVSQHVAELQALCSPRVRDALERAGIERLGYGDLETSHPGHRRSS
jgi:hopanoid biosynthesis associated protein HpnK